MSYIENESATFEDLCLRLERDFPGSPAAAFLQRFYDWRRYTLTAQAEAEARSSELYEALKETSDAMKALIHEGIDRGKGHWPAWDECARAVDRARSALSRVEQTGKRDE